jgi:hypothetical protein
MVERAYCTLAATRVVEAAEDFATVTDNSQLLSNGPGTFRVSIRPHALHHERVIQQAQPCFVTDAPDDCLL